MDGPRQNLEIALRLMEAAELLAEQAAPPRMVADLRAASLTLRALGRPVHELADAGEVEALAGALGAPRYVAGAILDLMETDRWTLLERLRGESGPQALFGSIPGVGSGLAAAIDATLGAETLEDIEAAAESGALATVRGLGPRRAAAIRGGIAGALERRRRYRGDAPATEPSTAMLLDIDARYRADVAAEALPKIAPLAFNPGGDRVLPILHGFAEGWRFDAAFSNSIHAHQSGAFGDWVSIHIASDTEPERCYTVLTATSGAREGLRVVRGRDAGPSGRA